MKLRWQKNLDAWRSSYFALPTLLALGGLLAAFALVALDRRLAGSRVESWGLIYSGGPDGARTVLSAMASSIITVAGIAYSITIAALVLASTQFGPRLLRNFIDDAHNQLVLGSFVGTFLFCLITLRTIRGESEGGAFVPQIAVTVAILLTIGCSLLMIYFFHHVAMSIQAPAIVADVSRDLHRHIDRLFPSGVGRGAPPDAALPIGHGVPQSLEENALRVDSVGYGYLQAIDAEALFARAVRDGCVVKLGYRPGEFVQQSSPLAWVWPREKAHNWEDLVRDSFLVGDGRTPLQDVEFGVNQLVEVACRALSPAINDPFTAIACLDHLGSALTHVLHKPLPSPLRYDASGGLRLIAERVSFAGIVDAAFNMIRQYGQSSAAVTIRLLEVLALLARHADETHEKAAILRHADMTRRDCQAALPDARDLADLEERYHQVLAALETPTPERPPST